MRLDRLPAARAFVPILCAVLVGSVAAAIYFQWRSAQTGKIDERTTLTVLRSEPVKLLVLRKTTTQVVVEYEEEDWLGHWRGVLWGVVEMHYGIDLGKVSGSDLRREGETVVVRVPGPELLTFALEPGSIRMLTKSTAAPKLVDLLHNGHRRLLEDRFHRRALEFAQGHGLMPGRAQLVRELNEAIVPLAGAGLNIRFE